MENSKRRVLRCKDSREIYGVLGTKTGIYSSDGKEIKVGDVIIMEVTGGHKDLRKGIVCADDMGGYSIMGSFSRGIKKGERCVDNVYIILSNKHLTNAIIEELHGDYLFIVDEDVVKMTKTEIEEKLGYPIEIVEG